VLITSNHHSRYTQIKSFIDEMLTMTASHGSSKASHNDSQMVVTSYLTFLACATVVYNVLSDGLSSLLTLSAGLQLLSFVLLVLKVHGQSSVSGISAKMLGTYSLTLGLRLTSTLTLNGYLPADATGDWAYQCLELASLALAIWLLQHVTQVRRVTFAGATQDDQDSMPWLTAIALGCGVLALIFHADLNHNRLFDQIWACACYLETAAMLPQLWMMSKAGSEVEALTSHFIALTTFARFFSLYFWYLAFEDGIGLFGNYSEMAIIGAHLVQLVLACDFLLLYVKSFGKRVPIAAATSQWI